MACVSVSQTIVDGEMLYGRQRPGFTGTEDRLGWWSRADVSKLMDLKTLEADMENVKKIAQARFLKTKSYPKARKFRQLKDCHKSKVVKILWF